MYNFGIVTCEQQVVERFGLYNKYMATACCDVPYRQQYLSTPSIEKVAPRDLGRYVLRRAINGKVKGPSRM